MTDVNSGNLAENIAPGSIFCSGCGSALVVGAVVCPRCGTPRRAVASIQKSKTAAVLLAVFLSYWAWLYTYKTDAWKFWVGLGVSVLIGWTTILFGGYFVLLAISIWAIIDVAVKPAAFYENYPNKP